MSKDSDEIRRGFAFLRLTCDPRGFAVLDALETIMLQQATVVENTVRLVDLLEPPSHVVTDIDHYSKKV